MPTSLLLTVIVAVSIPTAWGQCYLEDAGAPCAVCWKTSSTKVITMAECPQGAISVEWTKPLPAELIADTDNPTQYRFTIDVSKFNVTAVIAKGAPWHIPHSNIHSCPADKGACTPFVKNTPGLSTHTAAMLGNLTSDGIHISESFHTSVKLSANRYTIIAHTRFFVPDTAQTAGQSCYPKCKNKYDTAVGITRSVVLPKAATSTDAYIGTAIIGVVMVGFVLAVAWGARSGKVNLDAIMKSVLRDEVLLPTETLMILGDCITFTMTFTSEILKDNNLKDIIPASMFFLATGWIASLYCFAHNGYQMWWIFKKKANDPEVISTICKKMGIKEEDMAPYVSGKGRISRIAQYDLFRQYDSNRLALQRQLSYLVTMFFEEGPFTVLSAYILVKAEAVEVIVVVAFGLAAVQLGAKIVAVSGYIGHLHHKRELEDSIKRSMGADQMPIEIVRMLSEPSADGGGGGGGGSVALDVQLEDAEVVTLACSDGIATTTV